MFNFIQYINASHKTIVKEMFHCRDVCLVAQDPLYSTTACATLYYIGTNANPPAITYDVEDVAIFVEGQSEPVRIVVGNITVDDADHPTRYSIRML